ncbi:helix-turn-helix domain-containing protein [Nocardia sp. NBC_01503]|uniref:helix-turn-helix domain-containing protein n=1 Tax=Nocardia sp. NBC_01503 TaxID=2975997 RepID=UPI002E7BDAD1|nr:helix-turn-helix domain-containing protein [Nocardia sp. NBC_01503]WTL30138.1 helix-turn-helix domain-containing protein [Nocardia sp. NBC_01503]
MALQEVAELFGVHEATIRRWISNGRLTGYMVGPNTIRVRRDEVLALPRPIPTVGGAA